MILDTPRLRLVPLAERHIPAYQAFIASPRAAAQGWAGMPHEAWRNFAAMLGHGLLRGFAPFAMEARDDGRTVGLVGPWWPDGQKEREIKWHIWPAADEGKGLAHEGARAALAHVFGTLGWDTAVSYINPANDPFGQPCPAVGRQGGRQLDHPARHGSAGFPPPEGDGMKLTTPRLTLRPHEMDDYPEFRTFWTSDRAGHIGGPMKQDFEVWRQFAAERGHWALRGFGLWTLVGAAGQVLGWVGLQQPAHYDAPELAWHLTADAEGQGLAQEAARAALAHGRETFGMTRVISYVSLANQRSLRLAERLGAVVVERGSFQGTDFALFEHGGTA